MGSDSDMTFPAATSSVATVNKADLSSWNIDRHFSGDNVFINVISDRMVMHNIGADMSSKSGSL